MAGTSNWYMALFPMNLPAGSFRLSQHLFEAPSVGQSGDFYGDPEELQEALAD